MEGITMKKEVGKIVETMVEPWEELRSFEKYGQEPLRLKKGPKKGPKFFSKF